METQEYGVQGEGVNGDVSYTMPILGSYYYLIGLYATYISSGSESSGSESSYTTEDESTTSERRSDSGNSDFQSLECMQHFTLMLNRCLLIQFLILLDYQTTASELWDLSSTTTSTSECSTSQSSDECFSYLCQSIILLPCCSGTTTTHQQYLCAKRMPTRPQIKMPPDCGNHQRSNNRRLHPVLSGPFTSCHRR